MAPDSASVEVAGIVGGLSVLDASTLKSLRSVEVVNGFSISDVRPVPSLNRVMVTSEGGQVVLIDPSTGVIDGAPFVASGRNSNRRPSMSTAGWLPGRPSGDRVSLEADGSNGVRGSVHRDR